MDLFFTSEEQAGKKGRALFLCQAGPEVGLGHLRRSLAVALELGPSLEGVAFRVQAGLKSQVEPIMAQAGFSPAGSPGQSRFDLICLDLKEPGPGLKRWAGHPGLAVIHDRPLACDCGLFVWPELRANPSELAEKGLGPEKTAAGPEYVIVRPEIAGLEPSPDKEARVVVALGGGDPGPRMIDLVRELDRLEVRFRLRIALGGRYQVIDELENIGKKTDHPLEWGVLSPDLPGWLAGAALAVHGTGTTAYEVFSLGLAGVCVIMAPDQLEEARWMEARGLGLAAGLNQAREIAGMAGFLLTHPDRSRDLGQKRRALVDGQGAGRVAARMLALLN